jgi:hypothetical protein
MDNRIGYNPRGPFSPSGPRGGGMYPIQSLPPLVDIPFGGGPGLSARYPNPALLTSTRVSERISLFVVYLIRTIFVGNFT